VNRLAVVALILAVAASFSPEIAVVASAAVLACGVAAMVDLGALRRVLRLGLALGLIFAAALVTAAVAWSSGFERGLTVGAAVLLRLVVLTVVASLLARRVDADGLVRLTERVGLDRLGLVLGLALNTLPHLGHAISTVWAAHRMRSRSRWAAVRRLPGLAEVLLAHTARLADRAAAAASLRGHVSLGRISTGLAAATRTVVVTGSSGSGKTPVVESVVERVRAGGAEVAGFVQPAVIDGGSKAGFAIRDAATGERCELARRVGREAGQFGTPFRFSDEGFDLARRALENVPTGAVLVLDELGPVELRGEGHWPAVERVLAAGRLGGLVVVVRRALVPTLVEALDATDVVIVDCERDDGDPVARIVAAIGGP
jgi:nucleoside-triphosphatase THEP1/energy-coupling factor transporter transmembrane protein EcfT